MPDNEEKYGLIDATVVVRIDNDKTVKLKFDSILNASTQAPAMIEQLTAGLSFIKTPTYQKAATNPVQHRKPTCAWYDGQSKTYCNCEVDDKTIEMCNEEFAANNPYFKDKKGNSKYYCNKHFKAILGKKGY